MSREAMFWVHNPKFTAKSRKGADGLAVTLVSIIRKGDTDARLVADVLRGKAAEGVENARMFEARAAPAFKRGKSGWSLLAMEHARYYLIVARAVEKEIKA